MTAITPALATAPCTRTGSACTRRTHPPRTADHKGQPRKGDPTNSPWREPRDTDPHEIPSSAVSAAQSAPRPRGQQPGGPPLHKAPQRLLWRAAKGGQKRPRTGGVVPHRARLLLSRFTAHDSRSLLNNTNPVTRGATTNSILGWPDNQPNSSGDATNPISRCNNEASMRGATTNPIRQGHNEANLQAKRRTQSAVWDGQRITVHESRITNHAIKPNLRPRCRDAEGCRVATQGQPAIAIVWRSVLTGPCRVAGWAVIKRRVRRRTSNETCPYSWRLALEVV